MLKELLPTLAVIILIAGCAGQPEPSEPADQGPSDGSAAASPEDASSNANAQEPPKQEPVGLGTGSEVITYNTGDSEVWPSYDLPLEIKIEIPELPKGIQGPFPETSEDRD